MAKEHYPLVPRVLLRYPLNTCAFAAQVKTPLLLIHGGRDDLISPQHSERIQASAPHAKLLRIDAAGHGDVHEFEPYLQGLRQALEAAKADRNQLLTKSPPG
jgi:fermentation-respiration switch protein FrsA (DUF1100 family)